ncbi:MAG: ferritin-like domain-containing protein [Planctomycetes bacterium]|nr:ferritin-like domain-containing protein [Planctomycetota bacterium]
MTDSALLTPAAAPAAKDLKERDPIERVLKDSRDIPDLGTGPDRTVRTLQLAIAIEQVVEARYLRVGRAFTYGPIRRLFEEYAAEVRDHARILSRHLRDHEEARALGKQGGRRRRPRAAEGPAILTPQSLYEAFDEAFRAAERAIVFHRRAAEVVEDRYLRKFLDVLAHDHGFHLDILGHLLADIRDREMHLTPGRKLAPVDVPWVAAIFEGVVPPWRRDQETETAPNRWFINYM